MNREINFRFWDGERMENVSLSDLLCISDPWIYENRKIMQSTELYDKNNVEIYEGDIVVNSRDRSYRYVVKFGKYTQETYGTLYDVPALGFYLLSSNGWEEYSIATKVSSELEIIGNIYENPRLLKEGS